MIPHLSISKNNFRALIVTGVIVLAGNKKLKIYGSLECLSGKRMKKKNRVFFNSEREAVDEGFRPCGHCLRTKYLHWKLSKKRVETKVFKWEI